MLQGLALARPYGRVGSLRFLRGKLLAAVFVLLAHAPASAQDREPVDLSSLGPQVGEKIPDFALPDQHGRIRTLDSIMGERGAMLVFHRSADW